MSDSPSLDGQPLSGRDRLLRALRRPSRGQALAAVLLGVVGFAAVVQVRANDHTDSYAGVSQSDLIALINSQTLAQQRVEQQIQSLESQRDSLMTDTQASQSAIDAAKKRIESLGILAGTVAATGPGVAITVDGPSNTIGTELLVNGIQELRSAGAEAIQLNGKVRVVGQSSIQDGAGDSVIVDGTTLRPPYVIEAIGSPTALDKAVYFPEGFADDVKKVGGKISVTQKDRVDITVLRKVETPRYAHSSQ